MTVAADLEGPELGRAVLRAVSDAELFGKHFRPADSWRPWLTVVKALFGVPLDADELTLFQQCTGRTEAFPGPLTEAWLLCGRRSGKSRVLALLAVVLATFRSYAKYLAPGETAVVMVLATDRDQAQVILAYARALIAETPVLAPLIVHETAESIDLSNGVAIEVHVSSYKSVRGRTLAAALCDEISFWRSDDSRNPGAAVLAALRPGLSTIPGAPLLLASSVYSMEGATYAAFQRHHGHDDSPTMVWKAATFTMNLGFRQEVIRDALAADSQSATAEYLSEFLSDLRAFLAEEVIQASIDHGCPERGAAAAHHYVCFADPSGGRRDSFTVAVAHKHGEMTYLDMVREFRPPLDPAVVVEQIAADLKPYRIFTVVGDHYAGEWPVAAFRQHGLTYVAAEKNRSELYLETGPLLTQGKARLLDLPRLTSQLRQLERRSSPTGRDRVDHGPGGHDDVANAAMGSIWQANAYQPMRIRPDLVDEPMPRDPIWDVLERRLGRAT